MCMELVFTAYTPEIPPAIEQVEVFEHAEFVALNDRYRACVRPLLEFQLGQRRHQAGAMA